MATLKKALSLCLSLALASTLFSSALAKAETTLADTFSDINGTGISGVLHEDGRLVLSGNAKNGNFSLSSKLKADDRLRYVDFSAATGIVTLNGGGFAGSGIEYFDFPDTVKTVGSALLQNCTRLKSVEFPAFLNESDATVYTTNMLSGTTALESVSIGFVMDSTLAGSGLLAGAGRPAAAGGLSVTFLPNVTVFNDLYFAGNAQITRVKVEAAAVGFRGRPFASATALQVIDLSAVTEITRENGSIFQDIAQDSAVYLSSRSIAEQFTGSENNSRSYGNGHYCSLRTGLVVLNGGTADVLTAPQLPTLTKEGLLFDGYYVAGNDEPVTSVAVGQIAEASFSIGVVQTYTDIGGSGLNGTLLSNGTLALSGAASSGSFTLPDELKNDMRLHRISFEDVSGLHTFPAGAFAGSQLTDMIIPDTVTTLGSALFLGCTRLREITFPAALGSDGVTIDCTDMLSGTTALENVTIDFCMADVIGGNGILRGAGRSVENGGLSVVFGQNAAFFGDRYLCANERITKVKVMAEDVQFGGCSFAEAAGLAVIDLAAVRTIAACADGVCQNIAENSILYVDTIDVAQLFVGDTANTAAPGNGHYCSLRTGIVVLNGGTADVLTAPQLPTLSKSGNVFEGYRLADTETAVTSVLPGRIILARFAVLAIASYPNINYTGIDGVLYSDGRLVLSGEAQNGTFSLSTALKDDARVRSIDFSGATGIVTLSSSAFAGSSIEEFSFPSSVTTYGNSLFRDCRKLKRLVFPASFGDESITLYYSNFLNGTTALEEVEFHFVMSGAASPTASLLYGAGRPAAEGGLTVIFGEEVERFNDLYFAENGNIVCSRILAESIAFYGRPFASARALKTVDLSAVRSITRNNDSAFQDIGDNSVIYLSSRDIADMFIGGEENSRAYGNGHYCVGRTGLVVFRGAQIAEGFDDGRLPVLKRNGYTFSGYRTRNGIVETAEQTVGHMAIAVFTPGEAARPIKTFATDVVGSGLEAVLYTDGALVISGNGESIKAGAFSGETAIRTVSFPVSVTSIGAEAFSGTGLIELIVPNAVRMIGTGAFRNCVSLSRITLGNGFTGTDALGRSAFFGTAALEKVFANSAPASAAAFPGGTDGAWYAAGRPASEGGFSIVFGAEVTAVGDRFAAGAQRLVKVTFAAEQPLSFGTFAFSGCPVLSVVDAAAAPSIASIDRSFNWIREHSVILVSSTAAADAFSDGRSGVLPDDLELAGQFDPTKTTVRRVDTAPSESCFYPDYGFPCPDGIAVPGDFYCPPALSVGADGCAVISGCTDQAGPNRSITLEGEELLNGDAPEVWVYAQTNVGDGLFYRAAVAGGSLTGVTATMDADTPYGMYLIFLRNAAGYSRPVRVNAPRITWIGADEGYAGESISVYGSCLTKDNAEVTSHVFLRRVGAGADEEAVCATVSYADPYKVTFTVPAGLTDGVRYEIWLHNGHGGRYGFSEPAEFLYHGPLTAATKTVRDVTAYGAVGDGIADDTSSICAAIAAADSGDTVYFPNGSYRVTQRIVVDKPIDFFGAGRDNSTILIRSDFPLAQNVFYYRSATAVPTSYTALGFVDERVRSDTDGAPAEIIRVHLGADASGGINTNGKINFRFDRCRVERAAFEQSRTATVIAYPSSAIKVTYLDGISIENSSFTCADAVNLSVCSRMFIRDNGFYGNWISIAGEFNAPCAISICGNEKLDISGNLIYGRDALTDPQRAYAVGDETFGRAICMAGGSYTTWNAYIAKNDTKCIGNPENNLGEQILFESGATLVSSYAVAYTATSVTFADGVDLSGLTRDRMIGILDGRGKRQYRVITSVSGQTVEIGEPWTVMPDSTSYFVAGKFYRDIVVYANTQMAFANVTDGQNASCGIGGPCNTVGLIVDSNHYSDMNTPVGIYSVVERKNGRDLYDVLAWARFDRNTAERTKNGFGLRVFYSGSDDDTTVHDGAVMTGILFRDDTVHGLVWSKGLNVLGLSSYAIALGTPESDGWSATQTSSFAWIDGLVYEGIVSTDAAVGGIHLMKHQAGTVLRDLYLANDDLIADDGAGSALVIVKDRTPLIGYPVVDGYWFNGDI